MDPVLPNRRSTRLPFCDYGERGKYFVTLCTFNKQPVLGEISHGKMTLSALGRIIQDQWQLVGRARPNITLLEYVVMPNHFHALLRIDDRVGTPRYSKTDTLNKEREFGPLRASTLASIIGVFKSYVTREVRKAGLWGAGPFWQERFYDHVVRDAHSLACISRYIVENPARWQLDCHNSGKSAQDDFDLWLELEGKRQVGGRG